MVKELCYLGCKITMDGTNESDIKCSTDLNIRKGLLKINV